MRLDQMSALEKLRYAERLIDDQSLARLPKELQLDLVSIQQALYSEIQALQARSFKERTATYEIMTPKLASSQAHFETIEEWAKSARRKGEFVEGLLKGLRTVLAFF